MKSYATMDSETTSIKNNVSHAITNLEFSNAKIAQAEVAFAVMLVLLKCIRILHCIELK